MNFKVTYRVAGIIVILAGIKIYYEGWSRLYGFSVPNATAIAICLFGVLIILSSFITKKKVNEKEKAIHPRVQTGSSKVAGGGQK